MRAMAPKAFLRAFHSSARSASSLAIRTVPAPCGHADLHDPFDVGFEAVRQAGDLDEQDGGGVDRQPGMEVLLDRADAQLIHHLQRRGHHAGGDDRADRLGAVFDAGEIHQHRADGRRVLGQAHAHLRGDAAHSLGAHECAAQVVTQRLRFLAAQLHDLAVGQAPLRGRARAPW